MTDETTTNAIHMMPDNKVIMRIERDRIWVDPDVAVDETAQKVIGLLESHIVNMVERATEESREAKDQAYAERNKLVALLSTLFPAGRKKTAIEGWDEAWHGCVFIDFPWGQASWHYHDSQAWMFDRLPLYKGEWDGHLTDEKYAAIMEQVKKPQTSSPAALRRQANRPWHTEPGY